MAPSRRVLVWSPNYAPELTGIPPLVTDACEHLADRGHEVEVVTALPSYPQRRLHDGYRGRLRVTERRGGVLVHRTWLRVRPAETFLDKALYEASFAATSLPLVARRARRADVLVCVVPTLGAAAASALLPVRRRVLWVQDLVPAGALALAPGRGARRALEAAERVEAFAARRAHRVVVCSPGFRDHFVARGVDARRVEVVENWVDVREIAPAPPPPHGRPRVLYSGNIGYSQGFATLAEAARLVPEVEVAVVGAGNGEGEARALGLEVSPPVPRAELPALLASADVHVVLQRRVSAGSNLPSKIATYLASGRPIAASIDAATPAAELLRASGGALLVEPEDPAALAQALRRLAADPELRARLGARGRRFAEERLDRRPALERLERALLEAA